MTCCIHCQRRATTRGLCDAHYAAWRRSGEWTRLVKSPTLCACGKPTIARGLCWPCYRRARRAAVRVSCLPGYRAHDWTINGHCRRCGTTRRT